MLSRNDMLSTEVGGAPRARRSCYVDEPAYGFFIAGSSLKPMNGVYIRRNPPEELEAHAMLYYEHMDSPWTMMLKDRPDAAGLGFRRGGGAATEWALVDERSNDRFCHEGNTIVPGAGVRWKHVHRAGGAAAGGGGGGGGWGGGGGTLAKAAEDDEDELPWQVIAVLDYDILRQLAGGAQYHKERCAEAVAGRGVVDPPALTSLEGCYVPSTFIFRVEAEGGVPLYSSPSLDAMPSGRRAQGDYVRGLELRHDGSWLKIDQPKQRAYSQPRGELWVPLTKGTLVRLEAADEPCLESSAVEGETAEEAADESEAEGAAAKPPRRSSVAAEFLDMPFVPRLDDQPAVTVDEEGDAFFDAEEKPIPEDAGPAEATEIERALAGVGATGVLFPVGTAVVVQGLCVPELAQFNGSTGVVIAPPTIDSHSVLVRLDDPFAGRQLDLDIANIRCAPVRAAGAVGLSASREDEAQLLLHTRTLHLSLADLQLAPWGNPSVDAACVDQHGEALHAAHVGFGLCDESPTVCLRAALRAALRDSHDEEVHRAAQVAHEQLLAAVQRTPRAALSPAALAQLRRIAPRACG
ncbi:hypothetical protein AB1Y20_010876 [Prymnesium parvum]|uniref:Uncharacterized protein n=1 Tax=Prymnesium parvum TaxID=97485 RepID=A0AB34IQ04_PRYPA